MNPLAKAYRWVEDRIVRLLDYFESSPITLGRALALLGATFVFRNILEALAAQSALYYPAAFFVHFPLAYLPGIVLIPLVLAALSGERVERVTKVLIVAWTLTILPPVFELIMGHVGATISYLPIQPGRFWWSVTNYFNPWVEFEGATAGVRLEAALGVILGGYYVYLKRRKIWIALASLPAIFFVMVNVFSLPYIFHHLLRAFGSKIPHVAALFGTRGIALRHALDLSDYSTALLDLLYLTPLLALWLLVYNRKKLCRVVRWALRFDTGGFALATIAGLMLGYRAVGAGAPLDNPLDWMAMLGAALAILHVALGIRMLLPKESEKPSDEENTGPLSSGERKGIGVACLLLAVGYSGTVNYYLLGTLAVFGAAQAFLHLRPLNLRRIWPLSGLFIGVSVVAALATGLAVFIGGAVTTALPGELTWGVLIVSVLGAGILERRDEGFLGGLLGNGGRRIFAAVTTALGIIVVSLLPLPLWSRIALAALGIGLAALLFAVKGKVPRYVHLVWPAAVLIAFGGRLSTGEEPVVFTDLPPNPAALAALDDAVDFERNNLYAHAAIEYARAVEAGDERAKVLGPLAFNLRKTGRISEAEAVLERSVSLHSEHAPAVVDLAAVKIALGKIEEGAALYHRALQLMPNLIQPRVALGRLALDRVGYHRERGEWKPAEDYLEEALYWAEGAYQIDPASDSAAGLLATVHEELGNYADAYELWLKRAHAAPLDAGARIALARLALRLDKEDEAREYLEEAVELDPGLEIPAELWSLIR